MAKRMTSEPSEPSDLENPDILLQICARADTDTLRLLSQIPLWSLIRVLISTRLFWFLRVQMLRDGLIWDASVPWNDVWKLIVFLRELEPENIWQSYYATEEQFIQRCVVDRVPTTDDSHRARSSVDDSRVFCTCCYTSTPSLLRELLRSHTISQGDCDRELCNACGRGDAAIVAILLSDGGADPTCYDDGVLRSACASNEIEIVRLLLESGQRRVWRYPEQALTLSQEFGHHEIVQLLLEDKQRRAMPTAIHCLIVVALVWLTLM